MDAPRARVARIARVAPHTIHTHTITQSPPRQPSAAPGGAAGTQRSSGAEGDWRRRVRRVQRAPASRANRSRRRWQQQRRATSSSASCCRYEYGNDDGRLHQGKGSARALYTLQAGPALYKTGPVDCHRVPGVGAGRAQLATSRVTGPVWLPRAPPKCIVVRSGHGVACRSVSTSPLSVTTLSLIHI